MLARSITFIWKIQSYVHTYARRAWKCLHISIVEVENGWGHVTISKQFSAHAWHAFEFRNESEKKRAQAEHGINCIAFLCRSISFSWFLFISKPFQTISNNICVFAMWNDKIASNNNPYTAMTAFFYSSLPVSRLVSIYPVVSFQDVSYCYGKCQKCYNIMLKDSANLNATGFQFMCTPHGITIQCENWNMSDANHNQTHAVNLPIFVKLCTNFRLWKIQSKDLSKSFARIFDKTLEKLHLSCWCGADIKDYM